MTMNSPTRTACRPGRPTSRALHPYARSSTPSTCIRAGLSVPARHSIGDAIPAEQLARHAVALLAVEHALADRVLVSRWVTVAEALTYGATIDQVAAGMGLDVDEVRVGLAGWADGQHQFGHITTPSTTTLRALGVVAVRRHLVPVSGMLTSAPRTACVSCCCPLIP